MESKLLEYESDYGLITIEIESGNKNITRGSKLDTNQSEKMLPKFEAAISTVQKIGNLVVNQIDKLISKPDSVTVKVGLKFTAEAGAIIAKTSAEGNLELSMTWKKDSTHETEQH